MNEFSIEPDADASAPSIARSASRSVAGIALMLIGVATLVGGIVLHFAGKAGRLGLFPMRVGSRSSSGSASSPSRSRWPARG